MKKHIALKMFIIVSLLIPEMAAGQVVFSGQWESMGPEGGYLTAVAQDPASGNLYVATYDSPSRIYFSTDGGASWVFRSQLSEYVYFLEVDPQIPGTIYAVGSYLGYGTALHINKSTNAAMSWNQLTFTGEQNTGYSVGDFHIDRTNPLKLSITGYMYKWTGSTYMYMSYLVLSGDGGSSWSFRYLEKATTNEFYANCAATEPANESIRYVGGYEIVGGGYLGKIYRTTDDGSSWSDVTGPVISGYVNDIIVDPVTPTTIHAVTYSGVYRSTDRGGSWQRPSYIPWGYRLAVDPKNASCLYAYGGSINCYRSSDGGSNWTSIVSGLSGGNVNAVVADARTASGLVAVTRGGVFRSTNNGGIWSASNNGLLCSYIPAIKCVPSNPLSLYISVLYTGLYKTGNGLGKGAPVAVQVVAWEKLPEYSYCEGVQKIAISTSSPPTLYIQEGGG